MSKRATVLVLALLLVGATVSTASAKQGAKSDRYSWSEITADAGWDADPATANGRAGLEAAQLGKDLFVIGGRTPNPPSFPPIFGDSTIRGDVWRSSDFGATWERIVETGEAFPARAYHEVVTKDGKMFLIGGQNFDIEINPFFDPFDPSSGPPFFDNTEFFTDVWSSPDGFTWTQLTADAGFEGRAGLSAIVFEGEIYVFGGSTANDPSIVGMGGPPRVYFGDVWKSSDGINWVEVNDDAPWAARAGASVTVKDGYIYLLGGEFGFTGFPPPYFNDVWRTTNGADWELVTASADWSPRPGHQCQTLRGRIVCLGGFGQSTNPADPFAPSNPMDMWESKDGASWTQIAGTPWDATDPAEIKYDFDSLVVVNGGGGPAIYTFGGDRETFDFADPFQFLNVDADVWRFGQ